MPERSTELIIPASFRARLLDRSSRFMLEARPARIGKPLIFRQFLTSIWYPAYKVGADRSCDRYPCATRKSEEFTAIDRSRSLSTRESRPEIRAHVICDLFTFTPRRTAMRIAACDAKQRRSLTRTRNPRTHAGWRGKKGRRELSNERNAIADGKSAIKTKYLYDSIHRGNRGMGGGKVSL